jgi:ferrous iron transport protein B
MVMFLLTLFSWCAALLLAKLIRSTILRGPSTPFLLELPPYRLPTFKGLFIHTWERTWQYIQKAGTTILAISVLLWALMNYPSLPEDEKHAFDMERQSVTASLPEELRETVIIDRDGAQLSAQFAEAQRQIREVDHAEALSALKHSFAGRLGIALERLSHWCGFDWRINIALLGGFAAKEVIISALGTAYSLGKIEADKSTSLSQRMANDPQWSPLSAFALIAFIMLYAPCFATVACIIKESGSWKWGIFSMIFNSTVAFVVATLIYQGGRWLGIGT